MRDLSILIPAANEQFLRRTVDDLLANLKGDTEIIVTLDGGWADPPIPVDPRITVLYNHEPVGQRAATNQACRVAEGRWVMKLDAHCAVDEGFDVKMVEAAAGRDHVTFVPKMCNLWAFDWVCQDCGNRAFQGATPAYCGDVSDSPGDALKWEKEEGCQSDRVWREMKWIPNPKRPETTAMRFDENLRFQYWGEYKDRQEWDEHETAPTLSLLGACWMLTRARYWDLNICDEAHGSWGQQGTEVACKSWLSGGELRCVRSTWFAHMFRTQGGDFGFPWNYSGEQVAQAREFSQNLWFGNRWPQAVMTLEDLIERFAPVPGFESKRSIVFYTDNRLNRRVAKEVRATVKASGLPILSVSLKPMQFGDNIPLVRKPSVRTMVEQILIGLEQSTADHVFLCEHDVLYHPTHFDFRPGNDDVFYYNTNVWQALLDTGMANKVDDRRQTSGLCASRELLIEEYASRLARLDDGESPRDIGFEPGTRDGRSSTWQSESPNVDLRHGHNLTVTKRGPDDFRNPKYAAGWIEVPIGEIPGWSNLEELIG